MDSKIYHIYDSAFKRILTLSSKAVVNLINGLFGTEYSTDSKITYNWTEHENKDLKWTLADAILTINNKFSYHMEAQMTEDEEIVFRVFEYGFGHAYQNRIVDKGEETLFFPQPRIIYLSEKEADKVQDEYVLKLNFGEQGTFCYRVPVVKLQRISTEELDKRKMVILIPFFLLKLRSKIQKSRTKDNIEELQYLILNDIIGSINRNKLEEFTMRYDQSMRLESDKYDKSLDELEEEVREKNDIISELQDTIASLKQQLQEVTSQTAN
ncbi:MAG: hypothetical protein IKB01_02950 [Lachnospiraceae bacterium]|nr:hypothetical protein [Lachnospiraceae bacterium]MBR3683853.1 hypothetical protein [Lachnospiraceae bacterium]